MKTLEKNITSLFGDKGKGWLEGLPLLLKTLSQHWSLTDLHPIVNMNWNFVAKAMKDDNTPVVIKISCDKKLIDDEIKALQHFNGHSCVQLIDVNAKYNALLLEQAVPGDSLKSLYPQKVTAVIEYYADVITQLTSVSQTEKQSFKNVSDWLIAIDKINHSVIPSHLLQKARDIKQHLLITSENEYVLHGDLHHENIIQHGSQWLAIDPKGIVGEIGFEAAAFDLIDKEEIGSHPDIPILITERIIPLAQCLNLVPDRLLCWVYLRMILSAVWFIEDNGDPSWPIAIAKHIYLMVK